MRKNSGGLFWTSSAAKPDLTKERAMGKLPDVERQLITERIRSLLQKQLEMRVPASIKVICHNCGYAKPVAGAVSYGCYRLCNDCALQYELAKAEGDVQTIEDFVLTD